MKKRSKVTLMAVAGLLTMVVFFNQECRSQTVAPAPAAAPAAAPAPGTPAAAPATSGGQGVATIKGKVSFTGTAPAMAKLKREADPFCGKTPMADEEVTANPNGTLKNVAVRIVKGAPAVTTPPVEPLVVSQNNCMYRPRVLAGVTGQKVLVRNEDPIMHNVHSYQGPTTLFNQAQMKGSKDIEKVLSAGLVKFKCDVHPWMTGYTIGNDNPYIAVTSETGEFTLANVPAGTYTIEAWHEKYGIKTLDVTIVAGQTVAADFSYAAQ